MVSYRGDGRLRWVPNAAAGGRPVVDVSGNVFVSGTFAGSVTFGLGEPNQTTVGTNTDGEAFLARYTR